MVIQKEIKLNKAEKGFHLITQLIENEAGKLPEAGLLNIFIKHTSAALTLNENIDPSVRVDFHSFINKLIPETESQYTHTLEGADDMPAHIKTSLFGQSLTIPISDHKLNLGTWQGIYYCEFRNFGENRTIVITILS